MMRRMRWLTIGAILGIAGYRRLGRAARSLSGERAGLPAGKRPAAGQSATLTTGAVTMAGWLAHRMRTGRRATLVPGAGAAAFMRDVRSGMAEYLDRQGG